MKKKNINNNLGVTQIISFILVFALVSTIMTSAIFISGNFIKTREEILSHKIAKDILEYVAYGIIECAAVIQTFNNASYSKTLELPMSINGKSYYIEISKDFLYLNLTDGSIKEKTTLYNQDKLCNGVYGKVFISDGDIRVIGDKTGYIKLLD